MSGEPRYSILENHRFSREQSYGEKTLRELFYRGQIQRSTELWLWGGDDSRLAGTYETVFIRNRRFKERRIGLFGLSGSGKTSFLACCTQYGKRFDDGSIIVCADNGIGDSEPLKPTEEISVVDFSLLHDGAAWEIRTLDYPGRQPFADRLDDWFADADALLLMVDGQAYFDKKPDARKKQIEEIRNFLDRQRRRSPGGNRIDKPIVVAVSKADLIDYPGEGHPIFTELQTVVGEFGDGVACLSVSVLDGARDAPYQVAEAWCRAVREIDRLRIKTAPRTLSAFKELRDVWGINSGEFGRRVETEISKLEALQKNRQKTTRFLSASVFFLLLCLLAFFVRDSVVKKDFIDYLAAKSAIQNALQRDDAESALEKYRKSYWAPSKLVAELENLAGNKIAELDTERTETVFRTSRYAIVHAETPKKIDEALETFRRETVGYGDRHIEELENLAGKRRRELRFRFAWEKFRYELEQAETFGRTKRLYDEFLEQFGENEYPEYAERIRETRLALDRLIAEEREGVQFLPATAYYEKINRIDEQLRAFVAVDPRRKALEEDRKNIAGQWEPDDYRKFYEIAAKARSAADLQRAAEQAEHYLQQSARRTALRIPSRFEKDVKTWKAWFDGLKEKHAVELAVTAVVVPKSFLGPVSEEMSPKIVFTLQIGKVKSEYTVIGTGTVEEDTVRFEPKLRCRVEDAVWDEKKRTEISLTIAEPPEGWRSWVSSGRKAQCKVTDSEYPYIEFCPRPDGVFSFPVDESTSITVETDPTSLAVPLLKSQK